jgi:hypothetical protein
MIVVVRVMTGSMVVRMRVRVLFGRGPRPEPRHDVDVKRHGKQDNGQQHQDASHGSAHGSFLIGL